MCRTWKIKRSACLPTQKLTKYISNGVVMVAHEIQFDDFHHFRSWKRFNHLSCFVTRDAFSLTVPNVNTRWQYFSARTTHSEKRWYPPVHALLLCFSSLQHKHETGKLQKVAECRLARVHLFSHQAQWNIQRCVRLSSSGCPLELFPVPFAVTLRCHAGYIFFFFLWLQLYLS